MAPALKKRKISAVTTSKITSSGHIQSITAFGRISKSRSTLQTYSKDVAVQKELVDLDCCRGNEVTGAFKKKRRVEELETPLKEECHIIQWEKKNSKVQTSSPSLPPLPIKPRKRLPPRSKVTETPTKGARAFLEAFALSSSSPRSLESSPLPASRWSPPTSPISIKSPSPTREASTELPDEIQDLVGLYSSFLTALSLHYAHNGSFAPADLRVLRPSIERAWGKRRIRTEDVQRILGSHANIMAPAQQIETPHPLTLSNYGHGKICVELTETTQNSHRRQPLDVSKLNSTFQSTITTLWHAHTSKDFVSFISTLPLAPITVCTSLSKISPFLAKGQLRLTDLKAGAIRAQITASTPKSASPTPANRPAAVSSRSSSLLSRVKAKELYQSTLPGAPSPESIARRNALQRLEEVIPVLEILASSGSRSAHVGAREKGAGESVFSFTMPTVVQHLQMSLRNPIGKEEAVRCVRLLAEEIAPGWVGLKDVGRLKGVTVRSVRGCGREEMGERIRVALERKV